MEDSLSHSQSNKNGEFQKTIKEMISTLPRRKGWRSVFGDDVIQYQGFWYLPDFLEVALSLQQHYKAQPSIVILCSAPKTGTTWLKSLAFDITTRNSFDDSTNPLLSKGPHDCVPFLGAIAHHSGSDERYPKIPLLATHFPYSALPKSLTADDSGSKIVYICRNPKDTFVSMYHFMTKLDTMQHRQSPPLEEVFELFCEGITSFCGPYWDHVLEFWRASLERPEKILFLKYEEMREDTVPNVKKLAEFIGYPFSPEEEEKGVVEKIVKMCSFENLSNLEVNRIGKHHEGTPAEVQNKLFFRKGKVGDWENYLTPEMAARLDLITQQKLSGSDLTL